MTLIDIFSAIPNGLGVGAVMFLLLFWLMASGKLITSREHNARVEDLNTRVNDYKEQNQVLRETTDQQAQNFDVLIANDKVHIENDQTVLETLEGIKRLAQAKNERGDGT